MSGLRGGWRRVLALDDAAACATSSLRRRTRTIEIGTLAMFAIGWLSVVRYLALDLPLIVAGLVVTMGACAANLVLLRRTLRARLCGNLAVGALYALLLLSVSVSGGFYDPNFAWLYAVPVAAAWLVDLRSSALWSLVVLATATAFWGLHEAGIALPDHIPPADHAAQSLFNRLTAISGLAVLAASFAAGQRRAEQELARSNRELQREATCVRLLQDAAVAAHEAPTFDAGLRACAERVMESAGWDIAHVWLPSGDGSGSFVSGATWITDEPEHFAALQRASTEMRAEPGSGLVGNALASGRPGWLAGASLEASPLPRARLARAQGLACAVAIPIASAGRVVAVLEFFGRDPAPPDDRLLEVLSDVAVQVGRVAQRLELDRRLRQSQKLESVGQLAAGIAHEINNPMAFVRANLALLREQWSRLRDHFEKEAAQDAPVLQRVSLAECEELIDESLEGVDRTIAIVRDVKEFSTPAEHQAGLVDLNELAESALRVAAGPRGEGIAIERAYGGLPPVPCVAGQIRQVVLNLVLNACQALGGRGHLRVETEAVAGWAIVRIIDDGPGIAPEDADRLFDPFFTTRAAGEGTGLGLFISYEIARAHAGELRVESEPGVGTRFELHLPIAPA